MARQVGSRRNPETGKFEMPDESGRFSWELTEGTTDAQAVSNSEPIDSDSGDSGEFSLDSPTGFTVRPLTDSTAAQTSRLSFPLTPDGQIDFQKTSSKNLNKLRSAVQSNEAKAQLGLLARQLFQPHQLEWFLGFVGKMEAIAVSSTSRGKIHQDVANTAFEYSRDELKQLAEPATKIANKHASKLMLVSENFEEFQLASMLVMLTFAKYRLCVQMQAQRDASMRANGSGVPQQNRSIV